MRLSDLHKRVIASKKELLLLDAFPNAAAAYSLRKLRSAYTGNCIEVRRSSDNSLQNIGFVNNVLDTASLLSFVGAGNGFVRTWYDQSGNGVNGTQTTNERQIRIVNSAVLETLNSKPCLNTYQANIFRDFQTTLSSLQLLPVTILSVFKIDTLPTNSFNGVTFHIGGFPNIAGGSARYEQSTNNLNNNTTNRRGTPSIQVIISEDFNIPKIFASYFTTSQVEMRLNTVDGTPSLYSGTPFSSNTNFNLINANGNTNLFHASKRFLEQIIFFSDKHSDRVAIENNINNYYNIF